MECLFLHFSISFKHDFHVDAESMIDRHARTMSINICASQWNDIKCRLLSLAFKYLQSPAVSETKFVNVGIRYHSRHVLLIIAHTDKGRLRDINSVTINNSCVKNLLRKTENEDV